MVERKTGKQLLHYARAEGRDLLEHEALRLLEEYLFTVPPFQILPHGEALSAESLAGLPYPLVAKAVSSQIVHKTEAGAVRLDIKTETELVAAIREMEAAIRERVPGAEIEGWMVRPYLPEGTEIILGSIVDPQFGPAVMVGIGGVFTEAYRDVAFRLAPLSLLDAEEMIEELKGQMLLDGPRGQNPVPRGKLAALLVQLGTLMQENPDISECDLNPVLCCGETLVVADARVRVSRVEG
ncbi:MAG: acetate--CoA ligase family protein [Spirochaetaceae bacterium]|nr:MAG: acetate--CoA ligase family protein [Spirochaetaceae bacterium]